MIRWHRLVAFLFSLVVLAACDQNLRLDENLCAVGRPPTGSTVLLLDTSDPLSPQHQAELNRLLREMNPEYQVNQDSDFSVAPDEELVVYELTEDLAVLEPSLTLCNPGINPNAREWWGDLTEGRAIAQRRWQMFDSRIQGLFAAEEPRPLSSSPLIEALGVIVPRHVTSERSLNQNVGPVHLILYSDLLQHSESLSHYGPYPPAEQLLTTPALRHLGTNLGGVEVSIFRLERSRDARWQTVDHYYWWTELVQEFGGQVIRQESLVERDKDTDSGIPRGACTNRWTESFGHRLAWSIIGGVGCGRRDCITWLALSHKFRQC